MDDTLVAGTPEAIAIFKQQSQERFNIKKMGKMTKHLGNKYELLTDDNGHEYVAATIRDLCKEIVQITKNHLGRMVKEQDAPARPSETLEQDKSEVVNDKMYRTNDGKIMYMPHKLKIEGINAANEMSKSFMRPQKHH